MDSKLEADLDFVEVARVLWRGKWVILTSTLVVALLGVAYVMLAPQRWRSEVVLVQADGPLMPSSLAQLGGIASLAGVDLGSGSGTAAQVAMAVLRSKGFAGEFIEENGLVPVLLGPARQPDVREAVDLFDRKVRSVSEDKKTGVVTLSITWRDPQQAAAWANALVEKVNSRLRHRAQEEAERNIQFLRSEIGASNVPVLQQSLSKVLESEMQKYLLAKGNEEFAFKVVDRAMPPRKRSWPRGSLVLLGSVLGGLVISSVIVLSGAAIREGRRKPQGQ